MVVFQCECCGDSVKKPKAEQHAQVCRGWRGYVCLDCMKLFKGDTYKSHTSCISEAQKYQGALYRAPKPKSPQPAKSPSPAPAEEASKKRKKPSEHETAPVAVAVAETPTPAAPPPPQPEPEPEQAAEGEKPRKRKKKVPEELVAAIRTIIDSLNARGITDFEEVKKYVCAKVEYAIERASKIPREPAAPEPSVPQ